MKLLARYAGQGMSVSSSRDGSVDVAPIGPKSDDVSRAVIEGDRERGKL